MREDFLHYVWRKGRFDLRDLFTTQGHSLSIQHFGTHNHDAGPDFLGGQVRVNGVQWAGNVEIHVKSSDWLAHKHQCDPVYDNVILHVVLEEDVPIYARDGRRIPCLELNRRIPPGLLGSYWRLVHNEYWVPCQSQLPGVGEELRAEWLEDVLSHRLRQRSERFTERLQRIGRDWEEAFYQSLARAMGGYVNGEAMDMLARSVPLRVLLKHKHSLLQLEALLFGQSGLLPPAEPDEADYVTLLRREYQLLSIKHELSPIPAKAWRYLRLRPANFPTVRIAQLAAMLFRTGQLFGKSLAAAGARELMNMFDVELSNYWRGHYRFGKPGGTGKRRLGATTIQSLLINTVVPALVAYAEHRGDKRFQERAVALLRDLPAEQNKVIRKWKQIGVSATNAAESQALLGLKSDFCDKSRCMDCRIGCSILNRVYQTGDDGPLLTLNEQTSVYGLAVAS